MDRDIHYFSDAHEVIGITETGGIFFQEIRDEYFVAHDLLSIDFATVDDESCLFIGHVAAIQFHGCEAAQGHLVRVASALSPEDAVSFFILFGK